MAQIELENIGKRFTVSERPTGRFAVLRGAFSRTKREVQALSQVSFQIEEGDLVGYIGPNGAGKSTTVKVMSGILTPDSGTCRILGRVPWLEREKHVANLGVVFGQRSQLVWDLPVEDSFRLLRCIYDIPVQRYRERRKRLVETLDVGALLQTPVRQLSLGQKMRCELAAALLHSPKIVFLDEPTIGLDAVSKLALRDFLRVENRETGVTLILTTHDMDDIEALCSHVMVIGQGRLLYDGTLGKLKKQYAPLRCVKAVTEQITAPMDFAGAQKVEVEGQEWRIWFDPDVVAAPALLAQVANVLPLRDIAIEEPDIDQMAAAMYRQMHI